MYHGKQLLSFFPKLWEIWRSSRNLQVSTSVIVATVLLFILFGLRAPSDFPSRRIIVVRESASITAVAEYLKDSSVIRSQFLFTLLAKLYNPDNGVIAGSYYLDEPANMLKIAYRITHGNYGLSTIVFRVPEGSSVSQVAGIASELFPNFNSDEFITLAQREEGYLFPDTYHLLPTVKAKEVFETMRTTFDEKIELLSDEIREFGRPLDEVITMASYLEEEARLMETRQIVAGILWKRLDEEIPLQIDSSFQYVNGKNTFELTLDDLKEESPYNTYTNKGLTPTPLSSPGLKSIQAALTPIETDYYFFLTDADGAMHYAVTHDEHVANKNRYLR